MNDTLHRARFDTIPTKRRLVRLPTKEIVIGEGGPYSILHGYNWPGARVAEPEMILTPPSFEGRIMLFAPPWHQLMSTPPIFADIGFAGLERALSVNELGLHDSEEGRAVLAYEERVLVANPIELA